MNTTTLQTNTTNTLKRDGKSRIVIDDYGNEVTITVTEYIVDDYGIAVYLNL